MTAHPEVAGQIVVGVVAQGLGHLLGWGLQEADARDHHQGFNIDLT